MSDKEQRYAVKQEDYATLYSDGTILVKHVRASYLHVFEKFKGDDDDGKGKFSGVFLMPKGPRAGYQKSKDLVREEINRLIKEAKLPKMPSANKFLRDGDEAGKDEYEGMFTINASEQRQPAARDSQRDPKTKKPRVLTKDNGEEILYSGCWCNVLIRPWYQNNKFGKKVNAGLVAVQAVPLSAVKAHFSDAVDEPFGQQRLSGEEIDDTFDEFADEGDSGYDDSLGEDDDL